jgi:hypothetical protein
MSWTALTPALSGTPIAAGLRPGHPDANGIWTAWATPMRVRSGCHGVVRGEHADAT